MTIFVDENFKNDIKDLLNGEDLVYENEAERDRIIEAVSRRADAKKLMGVLYPKIMRDEDVSVVKEIYGKQLTQDEAKTLAAHFMIAEDDMDEMKEHGDGRVTESLNYFYINDTDETIKAYYTMIEE